MSAGGSAALDATTDFLPTAGARRMEVRSYLSLVRLAGRRVPQPAPGERVPAVLVPGFLSGDVSLGVLARRLRRAGHRTFGGRVGANVGCTEEMVDRLLRRLEAVVGAEGRAVALVGHSRGGMIAKLAALRRPRLVAGLVVLSAPVTGTLSVAPHVRKQLELLFRLNARGLRAAIAQDCVVGECAGRIAAELAAPLPAQLPYTSVYSRADAIINWRSCLDPAAETVEVRTSHTGMGTDARVAEIVVARLAALRAPVDATRGIGPS